MESSNQGGTTAGNIFSGPIGEFCREHNLLQPDADGVQRIPFLIKGQLRLPGPIAMDTIRQAFADKECGRPLSSAPVTHVTIGETQVAREPVIDRQAMTHTGQYLYSVMPVFQATEVIEKDFGRLCRELYSLPFEEILSFLRALGETFAASRSFLDHVREATLPTALLPDRWHRAGFDTIELLLDEGNARRMVDNDLCAWNLPGTRFLDGWVPLTEAPVFPEPVHLMAAEIFREPDKAWRPRVPTLRAMPTRQLHITAGNAPQIPLFSALRAILTKSPAVVKSPYGATIPGALLALAMATGRPDHPVTRHLSIVYWPGGDESVESAFFAPGSFDRIVVWGAPEAVESVKKRAVFTKVLTFNPRYGISMIGREAFAGDIRHVADRTLADSLVANQKACIASQIHYVEGDDDQLKAYAEALRQGLERFDQYAPNYIEPFFEGEIKRLMRGMLIDADWYINRTNGRFSSGVVVVNREFPLSCLTMQRMIIVRKVGALSDVLSYLHPGVSTVSIFPPARREELRDVIAAAGVSNIVDIGQSGTIYPGQSHDGMMVLTELVDWKNG
ncbi:MAG: acyl-CoA reductase [Thermodesulfobacteriota bacterium]